jgi:hypothetical protein
LHCHKIWALLIALPPGWIAFLPSLWLFQPCWQSDQWLILQSLFHLFPFNPL